MTLKPLAALNFEVPPVPSREIGTPGTFAWIPLSQLVTDDSYQRPIEQSGKRNIRRVIEEFHWSRFAPLVVVARDKKIFAVVDGQHHAIAALMHGAISDVPCLVLNCTREEEARAFATINGNVTKVQPLYMFRARVAAGDKAALAVERVAKRGGARIMPYPVASDSLKPGETLAAATIEGCIARYGEDVATAALSLITHGGANAGLVKAAIIEGFCDTLFAHPKWLARLDASRAAVAKHGVGAMLDQAMRGHGLSFRAKFAAILAGVLDKALGDGGKVERRTLEQDRRAHAKRGLAPTNITRAREAADREQGVIRAHASTKKPARIASDPGAEQRAIDAFIAKNGVRKVETGATGNPQTLLDWLSQVRRIPAKNAPRRDGQKFVVDGKTVDRAGLFAIVNRERAKLKLAPLNPERRVA